MIGQVYHLTASYRLAAAFLSLTILTLIGILILPWSGWIKGILIGFALIYCYRLLQDHVFRKDPKTMIAFYMPRAGVWQLINSLRQRQMARLLVTKTLCTRHVVILHFQVLPVQARTQSYSLFILSDSLKNQAFKSLRRQLRMLGNQ